MVRAQVRAYLAHTFAHRHFVRDKLTPQIHAIGISTRNPFYEPDGTTKQLHIRVADDIEKKGRKADYLEVCRQANTNKFKIVQRDLGFIDRTDLTIAYMTNLSKGTSDEIFYTGVIKKRPVFLLCPNQMLREHPWIIYECKYGKICKTLSELLEELKKRYG